MTGLDRVRARFLLPWLLAANVLGMVPVVAIWPQWLDQDATTPAPDAVGGILIGLLIFAVPALRARAAGLSLSATYGARLPVRALPRLAVLALPMIGAALVGLYVLFAPLSLAFPEATQAWLFEDQPVLYSAGPPYPWFGNLLSLVWVAIAAPVSEEYFFRGLLLRRWCHKWSPVAGVLASSLMFALLHADLLGAFVFGVFMCAVHSRYQSLWAPTIVHIANNAMVWCFGAIYAHHGDSSASYSIVDFRADWWLPVVGLVLFLPWAVRFRSRYGPIAGWRFPAPHRGDTAGEPQHTSNGPAVEPAQ